MARHILLALAAASLGSVLAELPLSSCRSTSFWISLPLPQADVQSFIDATMHPSDKGKVTLQTPMQYESNGTHPVHIEFDWMHDCKTMNVGILPYPSFQEVAIQVPYVAWEGKTVHYQPMALMNNVGGQLAMKLLGQRSVKASKSVVDMAKVYWSNAASTEDARFELEADVWGSTDLVSSAELADADPAWKRMVEAKKLHALGYDKCIFGSNFHCNDIAWHFDDTQAARIRTGRFIAQGGAPFWLSGHDFSQQIADVPGLEVFAVETSFSANIGGCGKSSSQILV